MGVIVFGLMALMPVAQADETTDVNTILRLEQAWIDAGVNGDAAFLGRFLHPDLETVTESGAVVTRASAIQTPKLPAGTSQSLNDVRVRIYGDTAIVTGLNRYRAGAMVAPVSIRFVDVLLRGGPEGWQVVSSQGTRTGQ